MVVISKTSGLFSNIFSEPFTFSELCTKKFDPETLFDTILPKPSEFEIACLIGIIELWFATLIDKELNVSGNGSNDKTLAAPFFIACKEKNP
jgi:hypothetical protein